jgi:hypothetical protein
MPLGIALLLIFILYLIDKHNRWRQLVKVIIGLVVLSVLTVGGYIGWNIYDEHRTAKKEQAQAARTAAWEAKVQECMAKSTPAGNATALAEQRQSCERDPDKPLVIDWSKEIPLAGGTLELPKRASGEYKVEQVGLRRVKASYDTNLTTTEYGQLTCGHVAKGEAVTLLADDNLSVRVKTAAGKIGWAPSGAFEVVN